MSKTPQRCDWPRELDRRHGIAHPGASHGILNVTIEHKDQHRNHRSVRVIDPELDAGEKQGMGHRRNDVADEKREIIGHVAFPHVQWSSRGRQRRLWLRMSEANKWVRLWAVHKRTVGCLRVLYINRGPDLIRSYG